MSDSSESAKLKIIVSGIFEFNLGFDDEQKESIITKNTMEDHGLNDLNKLFICQNVPVFGQVTARIQKTLCVSSVIFVIFHLFKQRKVLKTRYQN